MHLSTCRGGNATLTLLIATFVQQSIRLCELRRTKPNTKQNNTQQNPNKPSESSSAPRPNVHRPNNGGLGLCFDPRLSPIESFSGTSLRPGCLDAQQKAVESSLRLTVRGQPVKARTVRGEYTE
ncbi:hypothetical protein IFM58399_01806 [Aspergillus lentulus]|uniref:Uncharacterized protein n=1 Tax=Aspergillus lentulus TaxID=293939 RepID=A0ABQ1A937_ASPLE|nr:uncharacterized protein IFM58399_01806 [Aspergillus lentulus]GFF27834.1 hypothetical protein IFM58399_01806 [Aspergillus lentulus]GFF48033.1 hypothetical protein IFM62136_00915 [Aspergillus lentulus]GFF76531.1 hypothetical protein IFM60648_04726 [Aspergillus lentulus]GFF91884.1 hypothetical protein IFM47457_08992 [Aspergillus lentulus]